MSSERRVSKSRVIKPRSEYEITGNHAEAAVLKHIKYWLPKARLRDEHGRAWLVRTADEFRRVPPEISYSAYTIRKAVRSLAAKGLIELRHGPHPYDAGKARLNCSLIAWPEKRTFEELQGGSDQHLRVAYSNNESCSEPPSNVATSNVPLLYPKDTTLLPEQLAPLAAPPQPQTAASEEAESEEAKSEILDGVFVLTTDRLKTKFFEAWRTVYPDEIAEPWSEESCQQLARFLACTRAAGVIEIEAEVALLCVVLKWDAFLCFVRRQTGLRVIGARPSFAALANYGAEAVRFRYEVLSHVPNWPTT